MKILLSLVALIQANILWAEGIRFLEPLARSAGTDVEAVKKNLDQAPPVPGSPAELFVLKDVGDGKYQLEIKESQLEKDFLLSATLEKGTAEEWFFTGVPLNTYLWYFRQIPGSKVQFIRRNTAYRASAGTPEEKAVQNSFSDSIIATLPILAKDSARKTLTLSANELFLADLEDLAGALEAQYGKVMLSNKDSFIQKLLAFPKNLEASVQLNFKGAGGGSKTLPDARTITILLHYSLAVLPEPSAYQIRRSDSRVGYFTTSYQNFSDPDLKNSVTPQTNLIHRWNLRKKDPPAPVSETANPIVFWLEEAIPQEFRPAIKAGILAWNEAFESLGFRNAVIVKEVDKDMSPEERRTFNPANAAYNMVRWYMGGFSGAVGPSRAQPLTGEILSGSILVSDIVTRFLSDELDLVALADGAGTRKNPHEGYMVQSVLSAAAGLAMLEAKGPVSEAERKRFKYQFLSHIMAHEMGHVLGLRHNFKGSQLLPQARLGQDGELTSSVMDYLPVNIAALGKTEGTYYQTKIGPYDRWAIEYGYSELSGDAAGQERQLKAIAAKSGYDSRLAYGTDEDTHGMDPDTQRFDLGKDTLAFAHSRAQLARGLWRSLASLKPSQERDYPQLRRLFMMGYAEYFGAANAVPPLIGGVRASRVKAGEGGAPFKPVTAQEQRAALKFLDEEVFKAESFSVPPELLLRLGVEQTGGGGSLPVNLDGMVLGLQQNVLNKLYSRASLERLAQRELLAGAGDRLSLRDVFEFLRRSIWREIEGPKAAAIPLFRRNLQRRHLDTLMAVMDNQSLPGDARTSARSDLSRLQSAAEKALKDPKLGSTERAHLEDILGRIKRQISKHERAIKAA
ncbi:MAG: zinc-dependent metalloprotease [Elusimicrobia bacterium]|nr:zinc-dependent metalloprotease [Elusimicrobiota bacterium]